MNKYMSGIIAGFIATVVMTILLMLKSMMGLMPDLDIIAMLASMMGDSLVLAWLAHFMIGSIGYGLAMAVVAGADRSKNFMLIGAVIGAAGWLMMMIALMPMMGNGLFGLAMPSGIMIPIATLVLHLIFGVVLGKAYAKLVFKH